VMYYGHPVTDPAELKRIKAELLGIFGNKDKAIPPAKVDELEKALKEAGVRATILRYDADHAFANPSQARYDEKSAADAWAKVRPFLASKLRDPK
jgi:carboxymethylenebutenolidase